MKLTTTLLLLGLALLAGSGLTLAQTIRYVSTTGTNSNPATATSWATSTTSLQGAINASGANDQVWVKAGVYKPTTTTTRTISFAMKNNVAIYGGFGGSETALSQRPLVNPVSGSPSSTTLSGDIGSPGSTTDNSLHVINNASGLTTTAVLDGFVITAGNANVTPFPDNRGGGMLNNGRDAGNFCNPTVRNCLFQNNLADFGAAIMNNASAGAGNPVIVNCVFQSNTASQGGAIINSGINSGNSSPIITNCIFRGNRASGSAGGAIYNTGSGGGNSNPVITSCTFQSNSSVQGGAMYSDGSTSGTSNPIVTSCIFQSNSATDGGVLYNLGSPSGTSSPTLTNCIFQSNTATGNGGVMYNNGSSSGTSSPIILNCSFRNNSADLGTVTYNNGTASGAANPVLTNCVLFGNGFPNLTFAGVSSSPTVNYSLLEQGTTNYNTGPGSLTTATSPFLTTTSLNLIPCSPAVNAGDPASITAASGPYSPTAIPTTDVIGNPRIIGGRVDMGPLEVQGVQNPARLYVNASATGTNTGQSWTDAFTDLQSAITLPCSQSLTEIWVAGGTYKPTSTTARTISFTMKNGVTIYGGFAGAETALSQRPLINPVSNPSSSTLSGEIGSPSSTTDNSYHVIYNSGSLNNTAVLDGFVVVAGFANHSTDPAYATGGGIYNVGVGSGNFCSPHIRNCLFQGNTGGYGGAISNDGSSSGSSKPLITNCVFQSNTATAAGGGIYTINGSSATVVNCAFLRNSAGFRGGAIANEGSSTTAINSSFQSNTAANTGEVAYNFSGGSLTLANCVLFNNGSSILPISNNSGSATASYTLFPSTIQSFIYTSGPGNLTVTTSPFTSTASAVLTACTPAINAGNPASVAVASGPYSATALPATDLVGNARIFGGRVDMGAIEFVGRLFVRAGATGGNTGQSWADAYTDLQSALTNSCSQSYSEIWVATGIYKPTSTATRTISFAMRNGLAIYGGFAGNESNLSQRILTSPSSSTLSGDIGTVGNTTDNSYHVFKNPVGLNNSALLDGFLITGSNGNGSGFPDAHGGGMFNDGSSPTISKCLFQGNFASSGGAMYNSSNSGNSIPAIINCAFQSNSAAFGGAMYNSGNTNSSPVLTNCSFQGNLASTFGGAIGNDGNCFPTLTNCVVWNNGAGNTFSNNDAATIATRYCLFDASVTGYLAGTGNLTVTVSPYVSPTSTQLAVNSPAINAGDPATTTALVGTIDLAGNPRFRFTLIDMGAYESLNAPEVFSLKNGTWNDSTLWSVGRLPVPGERVRLKHAVTIPVNYIAVGGALLYDTPGRLIYNSGGKLQVGFQ